MRMSESKTNIIAALIEFQREAPTVAKSKTANVPTKNGGSYSYTYAGLSEVTDAARPLLVKNGLVFTSFGERTEDGHYELCGLLLHDSGEWMEGSLPLQGRTAQEIGSSITYGRRYLLGSMTGLITDDDDDGRAANEARPARGQRNQPPTPLEQAQRRVSQAYEAVSRQAFNPQAASQAAGFDVTQAGVDDLNALADRWLQDAEGQQSQGGDGR